MKRKYYDEFGVDVFVHKTPHTSLRYTVESYVVLVYIIMKILFCGLSVVCQVKVMALPSSPFSYSLFLFCFSIL
jgi:hypothetical protein